LYFYLNIKITLFFKYTVDSRYNEIFRSSAFVRYSEGVRCSEGTYIVFLIKLLQYSLVIRSLVIRSLLIYQFYSKCLCNTQVLNSLAIPLALKPLTLPIGFSFVNNQLIFQFTDKVTLLSFCECQIPIQFEYICAHCLWPPATHCKGLLWQGLKRVFAFT